jgi:hypothetical protein
MSFPLRFSPILPTVILLFLVAPLFGQPATEKVRPKKIFAHYMGCYPIGCRSLNLEYMRKIEGQMRPDGDSYMARVGGRWRDYPLTPQNYKPTLEEAMDLEIRRALRMGLDGFAVDVLAGQADALASLDAMFKVAEEKNYPFEITFCLDNPKQNLEAVRHLFEKHGKSPKLARRDGKPLVLGYRSHRIGERLRPDVQGKDWLKPENVEVYNQALEELEAIAGEPIYAQFCLNGALAGRSDGAAIPPADDPEFWKTFLGVLGRKFGGVNGFFWGGPGYDLAAKAAREAGMDWGEPIWAQYQNLYWNSFRLKDGTDLLRERWEHAIANDSTLIQIATWNDYTEATNAAPGQQTGYAINDLMGIMIDRWKTGAWPKYEEDRIYFFYPPYPKGSPVHPFHDFASELTSNLEVVTYLTEPGTVTLPGRNETWEAPAGLHVQKLPPTPGPLVAELKRGGKTVAALTAKEPISALPFRAQHSLAGYSTQDEAYWKEDFKGNTEPMVAYYGDVDGDGLPNWFEMFYFGKLGDFTTATAADPEAKVPGTNLTVRQAYLKQANPLTAPVPPSPGTKWDLLANPVTDVGVSTNPEATPSGQGGWRYVSSIAPASWELLPFAALSPPRDTSRVTYSRTSRNAFAPVETTPVAQISYQWTRESDSKENVTRLVRLAPVAAEAAGLEWPSPEEGTYQVAFSAGRDAGSSARSRFELTLVGGDGKSVWSTVLDATQSSVAKEMSLPLKQNEKLRLEARNLEPTAQGSLELSRCVVELLPH